jgi:hypothetical protein
MKIIKLNENETQKTGEDINNFKKQTIYRLEISENVKNGIND